MNARMDYLIERLEAMELHTNKSISGFIKHELKTPEKLYHYETRDLIKIIERYEKKHSELCTLQREVLDRISVLVF